MCTNNFYIILNIEKVYEKCKIFKIGRYIAIRLTVTTYIINRLTDVKRKIKNKKKSWKVGRLGSLDFETLVGLVL